MKPTMLANTSNAFDDLKLIVSPLAVCVHFLQGTYFYMPTKPFHHYVQNAKTDYWDVPHVAPIPNGHGNGDIFFQGLVMPKLPKQYVWWDVPQNNNSHI